MSTSLLTLDDHRWYGWQTDSEPVPTFVTSIRPIRPANGVIRLDFVMVRYPLAARTVAVDLRVVDHGADQVTGTYLDDRREVRTATLFAIDDDWIERLGAGRWPLMDDDFRDVDDDPQGYLGIAFGENGHEILNWSHELAIPPRSPMLPDESALVPIAWEYAAYESNRIREGFIPRDGEAKWRLTFLNNELHIHRNRTGRLIYKVPFEETDGCLYANFARANRNPVAYPAPDREADRKLILSLIEVMLLRTSSVLAA